MIKKIRLGFFLPGMVLSMTVLHPIAQASVRCDGWVGPKDAMTGTPFVLSTDVDSDAQTVISGSADGVDALLLYFKPSNEVEISVTDTKSKITAGSHGSFNGGGLINVGYSFLSPDGKTDRHVLLECQKNDPSPKTQRAFKN